MELTTESLTTVIAEAAELGLYVNVGVHQVPASTMFDWLQRGLVGPIDKGAGGNPPTSSTDGRGAGDRLELTLTVYMDRADTVRVPAPAGDELEPTELRRELEAAAAELNVDLAGERG